MHELEKTTRFHEQEIQLVGQAVTIFDADKPPYTINLSSFNKDVITFGRNSKNDIVLSSALVSREKHGEFVKVDGQWTIRDCNSTNGLIYNDVYISSKDIMDGDFVRIDSGSDTIPQGVLFIFTSSADSNKWKSIPSRTSPDITIGRNEGCTITLPHVSVSNSHAKITHVNGNFYITDTGSTNGLSVNGKHITEKTLLHEKDVIVITNSKLIFTSNKIYYCCFRNGISVDANDIVITRGKGKKEFVTCNHVNLNIRPGELVAIIGGSGAGKSTVLNCMCGYLKPKEGSVYINGVDLYQSFDSLKKIIGYVPQSDIVYDNLTVYDMLMYTAKLRLPADTSDEEREKAIFGALETVELVEKKNSYIRALSGGQKKRASIAVELLSDPNLLFLDEPASGLDPGTERNLMNSLRSMANNGKTVILVTHSTLQLKMCDKIVFMGKGGNLCYFGTYDDALKFFEVSDIVDIYNLITDEAPKFSERYNGTVSFSKQKTIDQKSYKKSSDHPIKQLAVLCKRYIKLVTNDRQRLLLLLIQAPLLALLISFVANDQQFEQYEMTKSLLFALSCSAFWIGMLNAIQEICKERTILKREFMTGLSLSSYVLSKILVLGILCFIQSFLVSSVFAVLIGMPEEGLTIAPFVEIFITTFLTAVSASAMGIFVSSMFTNADRAMTVAPILLMPQILFSGLIFKLDGATEVLSWMAVCRWSMEGYGTTANLNELPLRLQQEGVLIPHDAESFFEFSVSHMWTTWGILIFYSVIFLIIARLVLKNINKDR